MADTLTQLIDKVQDLLMDGAGTLFSTTTCTAAIRQALSEINLRAPIQAGTTIAAIAEQKEYELTAEADAVNAIRMTSLYLKGDDEYDTPLTFDTYFEDERIWFRLRAPLFEDEIMLAQFTLPHTVNGLDGEVESTLSALYDQVLVTGACMHACAVRSLAVVEANNLDKAASDNYRELARHFGRLFERGLSHLSRRRAVTYEPDARAWNDEWHNWQTSDA